MADINSDVMANIVARPRVMTPARRQHGRERTKIATVTLDGTQNDGDVMRFFRVKGNDRIIDLQLSCTALTGLTSADVGLYEIDGGGVVNATLFDSAQTLAVALVRQEKRVGSDSALAITTLQQNIAELLGLAEDASTLEYDLAMRINTSGSASGSVVLEAEYAVT